ncbi:unnamed protein product [Euphydryas editha]|uniref:BEN domain-containing protein n=1 Tax=Euphydryas editha TaxID=104508 RepID=A0AAU9TUG7_EUPED|nr:unnamed protein product [Euphydryas editha]
MPFDSAMCDTNTVCNSDDLDIYSLINSQSVVAAFIVPLHPNINKSSSVREECLNWPNKSSKAAVVFPEILLETNMAFVGYSSHSFDDANNPIRLQQNPAIRPSVTKDPTNRTRPPEDKRNQELKRLLSIPRLDISSFGMDNRAHEQSVPVDLRRMRIAKFTLPPDYNPNNSKWTFRHRYPKPELKELLRYSGVYVNAINLEHCNELATDYKSLTRLLMVEVFSDSALKVCSLTGAKASCFRGNETDVRPGLDKDARAILVRYVEIYGEKQGWCTEDYRAIINAMRNKLYSSIRKDSRNACHKHLQQHP